MMMHLDPDAIGLDRYLGNTACNRSNLQMTDQVSRVTCEHCLRWVDNWRDRKNSTRQWSAPAPRTQLLDTELYRYFDHASQLLYVGISLSAARRAGEHRARHSWWGAVTSITIERYPTRREALAAESTAIRTERPLHNILGVSA